MLRDSAVKSECKQPNSWDVNIVLHCNPKIIQIIWDVFVHDRRTWWHHQEGMKVQIYGKGHLLQGRKENIDPPHRPMVSTMLIPIPVFSHPIARLCLPRLQRKLS